MVREFKLPDVGEGVAEGEIVSWLVEEGDEVSEDQPVAEVETDKAVVEVPSPVNGSVQELHADAGEMVPVGDVIVTFAVEGENGEGSETRSEAETATKPPDASASKATGNDTERGSKSVSEDGESAKTTGGRVFAAPSARRLARELDVDIASVEGSGPAGRVVEGDVRAAANDRKAEIEAGAPESDPAAGTGSVEAGSERSSATSSAATTDADQASSVEPADRDQTLAAPATRRVARDLEVDLDRVPATEQRNGEAFVTAEAVREYADAQRATQDADARAVAAGVGEGNGRDDERVPYRGIRRTIGRAMERSKYTAPHVTHHDTADASALVETRAKLKPVAADRGISLTYMPIVMKACVAALREFPYLNSSLDEESEEIVLRGEYNVGVAVGTDAGLMVPVVEEVDRKGLLQIASETNELIEKARDRSITRDEMQSGTFTITNFGAIGGEYATPVINHPETAILGLGAIEERPVAVDGEVLARPTLPLSLSIDHRVIDGAMAARFANRLGEYIEEPRLLLLD